MSSGRIPDDLRFRSLAAPGLDEDDLFVAMAGLPAPGPFWGEGRPWARPDEDRPWSEEDQRRRRHEELMRKWPDGRRPPAAPPG
jgi:hypothetical protein